MRTIFFLINFSISLACLCAAVYCIGAAESPGSFCGGVLFIPIALLAALWEWSIKMRRSQRHESMAGVLYCILGIFWGFAAVTAYTEASQSPPWPDGFGVVITCLAGFSAYLLTCGLTRIHWQQQSRKKE